MNRVVIITGSTRGIGFETAAEFLKNSDRVVIFCRHSGHGLRAKKRLSSFGPPENLDPSEVLAQEYVPGRIFEAAKGKKKTGFLFKVYS